MSIEAKLASRYSDRLAAANLGSLKDAAFEWAEKLADAILKAIPKGYKLDKAKAYPDSTRSGFHIKCEGTSIRDLTTTIEIYFMVDSEGFIGQIEVDEVGMGKSKQDLKFAYNVPADRIVSTVVRDL